MAFAANANMVAPVMRSLLVNGSRVCLKPATIACYSTSTPLNNRAAGVQSSILTASKPVHGASSLLANRLAVQEIHSATFRRDTDPSAKFIGSCQIFAAKDFHTTAVQRLIVPLPALSPTMESGNIVSWHKQEGDSLNEGDLLAEIETDKATMAFETPEEGFLARILVEAGTKEVPLGRPLCIIVEDEGEVEKYKSMSIEEAIAAAGGDAKEAPQASQPAPPTSVPTQSAPPPPQPTQQFQPPQPQAQPVQPQPTFNAQGRTFASPLARKLAREMGNEIPATGSGPNGRVVANDVINAAPASPSSLSASSSMSTSEADYIDIPLTNMRQTIAKRLTQSKQTIPHYYLTVELAVDSLMELRKRVNEMLADEGVKLSVNDFIIKAAALACKQVPQVNSMWQDTFVRQFNKVDVCVAVSTDSGLITPIVFDAANRGVRDIGVEVKNLAQKARQNKLQPHEFQGGTFTISNLGMFDIDHFTAVINPPQSAILAVGSVKKAFKLSSREDELFEQTEVMKVTLSCDHRVVDGAVGARWLQVFRGYIEKPFTILI